MTYLQAASELNLTFVSSMKILKNFELKNCYAVGENFDHEAFAQKLSLIKKLDAKYEEEKYGGVGFITYKTKENTPYYNIKTLEVVFQNGLPLAIKLVE